MRTVLVVVGAAFLLLGFMSLVEADFKRRAVEDAPRIVPLQEQQAREGLRSPSDISTPFKLEGPYIGQFGLNSPASLAVRGGLSFVAGAGILYRRRWAMLLGLPLLIPIEAFAIPIVIEQFRQGNQPGSFAVIGIPMFGSVAVFGAFAFFVLVREALGSRGTPATRIHK